MSCCNSSCNSATYKFNYISVCLALFFAIVFGGFTEVLVPGAGFIGGAASIAIGLIVDQLIIAYCKYADIRDAEKAKHKAEQEAQAWREVGTGVEY